MYRTDLFSNKYM